MDDLKAYLAAIGRRQFRKDHLVNILIGDWCRCEEDTTGSYQVIELDSLWDACEDLSKVHCDVKKYYEVTLEVLAEFLNSYHQAEYSLKYWNIMLWPWLYRFLCVLYDKYVHIQSAVEFCQDKYEVIYSHVMSSDDFFIPVNVFSFRAIIQSDYYVLQIITDLCSYFNICPIQLKSQTSFLKRYYAMLVSRSEVNNDKKDKIRFDDSDVLVNYTEEDLYLRRMNMTGTRLSIAKLCTAFPESGVCKKFRDFELNGDSADDHFLKIVKQIITRYIPCSFLESFRELREKSRNSGLPSVFLNEGWHQNELWNITAARMQEKGSVTCCFNPGGVVDILRCNPIQEYEESITTFSICRAPNDKKNQRSFILPSRKKCIHERGGARKSKVLFLSGGFHHPHILMFITIPITKKQIAEYFFQQSNFFNSLPQEILDQVMYRPHPYRGDNKVVKKLNINMELVSGGNSLEEALAEAELVIVDHITTSIYKILQYNVPMLLFWDRKLWQGNSWWESLLNEMEEAGIFFSQPQNAALELKLILSDIEKWWSCSTRINIVEKLKDTIGKECAWPEDEMSKIIERISPYSE